MSAALILEEGQDLKQEQRIERLETDSRNLQTKVSEDIAALKKALHDMREAVSRIEGNIQAPRPWLVPSISLVGVALIAFLSWLGLTTVQHGNALASIRQALLGQGVMIAAGNPTSPKAQAAAQANLAEAKKTSIAIAGPVIEQAGESFIEAAKTDPKAWGVALDFVSYRSSLNTPNRPIGRLEPIPPGSFTRYAILQSTGPRPEVKWLPPPVPYKDGAIWDIIGQRPLPVDVEIGAQWLFAKGGRISLDETHIRQVVFEGAEIHYSGERVILEDVIFINCTFVFDNNEPERKLGLALLDSSKINFEAPPA
jgi:hypothetical protein